MTPQQEEQAEREFKEMIEAAVKAATALMDALTAWLRKRT